MVKPGSTFRRLVNSDSVAALEAELDADQARFRELLDKYGRIRDEMGSLGARIERQEKVIEAIRNALPNDDRESGPVVKRGDGTDGVAMTKREIATEILRGSVEPLFPRQVREIAIKRGWISTDKAAANQLSVAMARAVNASVFVRDRKGRYSLPNGKAP